MSTISLRITGLEQVQTGFNKFAATLEPVTRAATYAALERASKVSPGYLGGNSYTAPESGYVRTGNLGRSVQLEQDGLSSRLSVSAFSTKGYEYGHLIIGTADGSGQGDYAAAIGWVPLRKAVDDEIVKLTTPGQGLGADLQKSAKDAGL